MSVKEIKEVLHKEIDAADDVLMLQEVYELLRSRPTDHPDEAVSIDNLSPGQRAAVLQGLEDIKRGNVFTQEEVDRELDEWFEEEDKKWSAK